MYWTVQRECVRENTAHVTPGHRQGGVVAVFCSVLPCVAVFPFRVRAEPTRATGGEARRHLTQEAQADRQQCKRALL